MELLDQAATLEIVKVIFSLCLSDARHVQCGVGSGPQRIGELDGVSRGHVGRHVATPDDRRAILEHEFCRCGVRVFDL